MQSTLLAFAAPRPEDTTLDCMYRVARTPDNDSLVTKHVTALTMVPKVHGPRAATPFEAFRLTDLELCVPRFYGLAHFGPPKTSRLSEGASMEDDATFSTELFDDQKGAHDACVASLRSRGGCVCIRRAGGGKTVIALRVARTLGRRTLVLVHKSFFLEQWTERIKQFLPDATVGVIRQSKADLEADFVIGMIQTLIRRDFGDQLQQFGTLLVDECHHIGAPMFLSTLFKDGLAPRYVMGCTATPDRADKLTSLLEYGLGEFVDTNDTTSALEGSQREVVHVTMLKYNGGRRREYKYGEHVNTSRMISDLVEDVARTARICDEVVALHAKGHQTIVFSERIDLLNYICEGLQARGVADTDLAYYYGKTKARERLVAAQRRVLLSTFQMAREGLDIPTLSACVFATPIANVEQAVGRVQRPCPTKVTPVVCVDVLDTFSVFLFWAKKRRKAYESFGFPIVEAQ